MSDREVGGRVPLGALAIVVLIAAAVRTAALLHGGGPVVDADEAIVGIMARHIATGQGFPLYYYGQNYLGALEAWCAAAVFAVAGPSALALKAVPAAFSLVVVVLIATLGARVFSARAGLLAALLFALPPSGLLVWCLKARGGFMEVVAIGSAVLLVADIVLFRGGGRSSAFLLGALLGLGWWVNQQILYYAVPIVLWTLLSNRRDPGILEWLIPLAAWAAVGLVASGLERPAELESRLLLASALGVAGLLGCFVLLRSGASRRVFLLVPLALLAAVADDLPALGDHTAAGRLVVAATVLSTASWVAAGTPRSLRAHLLGGWCALVMAFSWWNPATPLYAAVAAIPLFVDVATEVRKRPRLAAAVLGTIAGSAPFWVYLFQRGAAALDVVQSAELADLGRQAEGFVATSLPMLLGARPFWAQTDFAPLLSLPVLALYLATIPRFAASSAEPRRRAFLATFLVGVPIIFVVSRFGWFAREPRYLLPIYSVLFFLPAVAADELAKAGRRWLGAALIATLLAVHAHGILRSERGMERPDLSETERVAADHSELHTFLDRNHLGRVFTNYWIGYRLAFETDERVLFAPLFPPFVERIPAYGRAVRRAERPACVLPPTHAALIEQALRALGVSYRRATASGYIVLYDLERPERDPGVERLVLRPEWLAASASAGELARAIDGDAATRWTTHSPQAPGMWVEIRLPEPRRLGWLSMSQADFTHDYPRGMRVVVQNPDGTEEVVADSAKTHGLLFWAQAGRIDVHFVDRLATRVRIEQTGSDRTFDWSIAEMALYGPREG